MGNPSVPVRANIVRGARLIIDGSEPIASGLAATEWVPRRSCGPIWWSLPSGKKGGSCAKSPNGWRRSISAVARPVAWREGGTAGEFARAGHPAPAGEGAVD